VSEGDPGNRAAVARAISGRVRELGWRQRELADRSHVSDITTVIDRVRDG
jgi:hypothetical protein